MFDRPLDVSDAQAEAARSHAADLDERLRNHVSAVLAEVEDETLRTQIRFVAFEPNDALPKRRHHPPTGKIQYLVEQLYLSCDPEGDRVDDLLRATTVAHEYYDIVDDVIDGDVADGSELEVFVTNELLGPLLVRLLGRLGPEAVDYWSARTLRAVGSFVAELSGEPSADAYRDLVERQSNLFGSVAGLSAVVAGADEASVERAATAGRAYFQYEQFLRDLYQYERDDPDPWNAWRLLSESEALAYVSERRMTFERSIADLPAERERLLRPLVATDLDAFRESLR